MARSEALIRLKAIIRNYKAKLEEHFSKESNQITQYFNTMIAEADEQKKRGFNLDDNIEAVQQKRRSLELEKQARLNELQKKLTLKVDLKLLNALSVAVPKIATPLRLISKRAAESKLMVIWNPLTESVEPMACPQCRNPTLELSQNSRGAIQCALCPK